MTNNFIQGSTEAPNQDSPPDVCDVLATAVLLAAEELAQIYPQPSENGVSSAERWKKYLLQCAFVKQQSMNEQERTVFRLEHFSSID